MAGLELRAEVIARTHKCVGLRRVHRGRVNTEDMDRYGNTLTRTHRKTTMSTIPRRCLTVLSLARKWATMMYSSLGRSVHLGPWKIGEQQLPRLMTISSTLIMRLAQNKPMAPHLRPHRGCCLVIRGGERWRFKPKKMSAFQSRECQKWRRMTTCSRTKAVFGAGHEEGEVGDGQTCPCLTSGVAMRRR